MTTPINSVPELVGSVVSFTQLNTLLRHYEALGNLSVIDTLATPPGSPNDGDAYLVIPTATGTFLGQEDSIGFFIGGAAHFLTPSFGLEVFNQNTGNFIFYNGSVWQNSPKSSVTRLTLSAAANLDYARNLIVDSTTVTHTLGTLAFNAVTTISNVGATDFSVTASTITHTVVAGTTLYLAHTLASGWELI